MTKKSKQTKNSRFDCGKCISACCSYPLKIVTKSDMKRLAKGLETTVDDIKETNLFQDETDGLWYLRNRRHTIFTSGMCAFQKDGVGCTIYEHRPDVCRDFGAGKTRCGFYDFLSQEREHQDDPKYVPVKFCF